MQKTHLFFISLTFTIFLTFQLSFGIDHLVYAASPVPSVSSKPTSSPEPASSASINEVTENLKKRLQDSIDEPVATPPSTIISYVGIVKDIIKDTIIIEDKDGKRDIKLKDDTKILRTPGNAAIKPENIRIDDYMIAIGYLGDDENLNGRRLIVSTAPIKPPTKTSDLGTIAKITKSSLIITVAGEEQVLDITAKTIYKSSAGTIEYSDLAVDDTIIFTATINEEDERTATHVMRILSSAIEQ